ncbi:hypothetical protein [Puniceicoccus vermicola]|uniref:Type II toxin-antitoxin system RelE/ParE family toxin n=1 Tax=Puniceicoccus vermicola TaxID=388746 RepID=A0A7X1AWE8_9BACT|nr:hypothetical protein [Puniceicoccus vermicola]MBC2601182.1 hypothetical protein [Puniceicoccus vermicola]
MSEFTWSASQQVVERLLQIRGTGQRQKVTDFFDRLSSDPLGNSKEDFLDEDGNIYHLVVFDRWLITYHIDDAIRQVNVLALELS